ncbi:MGH1-like glycoside hydrolase domain-containing protein [Croceivirga sp. JEA036]|uniref:MGH1-like glycoside hydrolase domain-containing protein n=1 Tax=Croceivirga sp. JEA036 TaxID=2721162 RepID=UPI00143A00D8|nr:trehalase family glycosidase [Croceivirga sp. JEA036]NJB36751.1 glycoside hydrolase [Croceivirga sp. JEA036]
MYNDLIQKAKTVLDTNFQPGGFTIPSKGLYPFQWKWDAGFIAIGFAHYDVVKAKKEIETLLNAQWKNGFIPHIVFHTESDTYFPGPDFHQSHLSKESNPDYPSTGMVQPPVLGFVLEHMLNVVEDKKAMLQFISTQIDKVFWNHEYFYKERDVTNEGLVYIYHNWESGTDNSPIWDDIWATMNPPQYTFKRKDTSHVDASQRPSNREYDHYLYLIDIAKKYNYKDAKIAEHSPFLVLDPLFNAMLIKSNESLINLYKKLGGHADKIKQLETWQKQSVASFNSKLFNEELGAFVHYDLKADQQIPFVCSSSFAALYAPIVDADRAEILVNTLQHKFGDESLYLCASFDPSSERYDPKRYWRGPVWINMNWILYLGLKRAGKTALAARIKADTLTLLERYGFYEYFDARKKVPDDAFGGYGGDNFSWSAALFLDFVNEK